MFNPSIIEQTNRGEKVYDLGSRLFKDRIILLDYPIGNQVSNLIVSQLLFLEADDPERDIQFYINCSGMDPREDLQAGLAIYDTIEYISADVSTICIGVANDMAALLLAAGAKGKRFALPNSRITIRQPIGRVGGQATDIEIQAKELIKNRQLINDLFSEHTNKSKKEIEEDTERDFYMSSKEAKEYGIIDTVFESKKKK
jgi:ATP-dependent Clp protease, protease subunit